MKTPHPDPVPDPPSSDPALPQAARTPNKVIHLVPEGSLLDGLDGLPTPPPVPCHFDEPLPEDPQ
jgi:hypothetical protein